MRICDCERGHNGLGMTGRECDCGPPPEPCPFCQCQLTERDSGYSHPVDPACILSGWWFGQHRIDTWNTRIPPKENSS